MRDRKRLVIGLLAGVVLALIGVALLFYLTIVRPLRESFEGRGAAEARIEMLADAPDALILSAFVTGDVPRLLTGPALEQHREALWVTSTTDAGNVIGASIFLVMGMPPVTDIATSFREGAALRTFDCLTVGCRRWPEDEAAPWGLAPLRELGPALGPEVRREHESFAEHDAYLAAHAEALADPLRWFVRPGAEVAVPADDGTRLVVVALPSELLPEAPDFGGMAVDPARLADLQALAETILGDSGGTLQAILGVEAMPIWAMQDGLYLNDAAGTRALPQLTYRNPVLRLEVPVAGVAGVLARVEALALAPADLSALDPALAAAFADWGLDGTCLPGCGGFGVAFREQAEADVGPAPFWTLDLWHLPQPG